MGLCVTSVGVKAREENYVAYLGAPRQRIVADRIYNSLCEAEPYNASGL
jgi:hypothetical protein